MRSSHPHPSPRHLARSAPAGAPAAALCVLFLGLLPGCQMGYLWRQAFGVLHVARSRVPIDDELRERLAPAEREKLHWAARVREYAGDELGLDTGDAYTTYYDTGGAPISTVVVASDPLALVPYLWHFPLVGNVPYKGYFDPDQAEAERERLQRDGWDAVRLPVQAFSTLGWFSDPLLSSLLELPEGELAEVLIHELTHRTVYFPGSTEVNESLATTIAREGTLRLLEEEFGGCSPVLGEYRDQTARDDLRGRILDRLRSDLDALYRSTLPREAKLERKAEIFETSSRTLREAGVKFHLRPSNALLVLERQYDGLVPFFLEAMSALGGRPRDLIASLKKLRGSDDAMERLAEEVAAAKSRKSLAGDEGCTPPSP